MNNNCILKDNKDNNEYILDEVLDDELYEYLYEFEGYKFCEDDDFNRYEDTYWKSGVQDIDGGDNFIDYCEYIFSILEEEGYYD